MAIKRHIKGTLFRLKEIVNINRIFFEKGSLGQVVEFREKTWDGHLRYLVRIFLSSTSYMMTVLDHNQIDAYQK
jgi:hypothetical protein